MIIEKRKKDEEKWEEIDLDTMVSEIIDCEYAFADAHRDIAVSLEIALTKRYKTHVAEYRII